MAGTLDQDEYDPLEGTEGAGLAHIARPGVGDTSSAVPASAVRALPAPSATSVSPATSARTAADEAELNRLQTTGSGISQIKNPIARGALRGLNVAGEVGSAFLPELRPVLNAIPGTEEHHQQLIKTETGRLGTDLGAEDKEAAVGKTTADTSEATARANLAQAQADVAKNPKTGLTGEELTIHDLMTGDNGKPRVNPKTGQPYTYLDAYTAVNEAKENAKPAKPESQEQNKLDYQKVIGKLDAGGLSTDPKNIDKSLDSALKQKLITKEEHAAAKSYEAANQTPGTNLTVHVAGTEAAENTKQKGGYYAVNGRIVRGDRLSEEERANALPVKSPEEAEKSIKTTNATLGTFQRYQNDINKSQLTPDDVRALQVLTAPDRVAQGFLEKDTGGVLDTLFGEPLTGYSTRAMSGIMTKDQYDKLSPAGQKLLVGYYNSIIANFADMKARLGSIGRNEAQVQAELHTIPLPYIGKDAANEAINRKLDDVAERNIYFSGQPSRANSGNQTGEEVTATGPKGEKIVVRKGQWVDAKTGAPVQ